MKITEENRYSLTVSEGTKECQLDIFDDSKEYEYKNCLFTNNFELDNFGSFLRFIDKWRVGKKLNGLVIQLDFFNENSIEEIKQLKKIKERVYFYEFSTNPSKVV